MSMFIRIADVYKISLVFMACLIVALISSARAWAQQAPVGTNCSLPTPQEIVAGAKPGIQLCDTDRKAGISTDVGVAKEYLNSLPKRPLSQCAPPTQENIYQLTSGMAVCAAAFFKAYTAQYGTVYITSAFRDNKPGSSPIPYEVPAGTENINSANQCAKGVPDSRHALGLAIDVNPASESLYPSMWQFASDNPQYGVCFPYQDGRVSGNYDRPHMVLAGIGGHEGALCAAQGVKQACSNGIFTSTPTAPSFRDGVPPMKGTDGRLLCAAGQVLIDALCYVLPPSEEYYHGTSVPQPYPTRCPYGQFSVGGICIPTLMQPNMMPYPPMPLPQGGMMNPPQSFPSQPPQQTGTGASLISGMKTPSTVPASVLDQLNQSTNINLHLATNTSASSLINAITSPRSPGTFAGAAILNPDVISGAIITNLSTSGLNNQGAVSTSGLSTILTLIPVQTFVGGTSSDAPSSYSSTSSRGFWQDALENLRSVLVLLLGYLQGLLREAV